jgi:hypothetical protein
MYSSKVAHTNNANVAPKSVKNITKNNNLQGNVGSQSQYTNELKIIFMVSKYTKM